MQTRIPAITTNNANVGCVCAGVEGTSGSDRHPSMDLATHKEQTSACERLTSVCVGGHVEGAPPPGGISRRSDTNINPPPPHTHKWPKAPTPSTLTPTRNPLEPGRRGGDRVRRTHSDSPYPAPCSTPSPQQHAAPPPNAPHNSKNREGPEETGHGEKDEQGEITGQGRPRSPKTVQCAGGGEGKDTMERIIVVVRSPC